MNRGRRGVPYQGIAPLSIASPGVVCLLEPLGCCGMLPWHPLLLGGLLGQGVGQLLLHCPQRRRRLSRVPCRWTYWHWNPRGRKGQRLTAIILVCGVWGWPQMHLVDTRVGKMGPWCEQGGSDWVRFECRHQLPRGALWQIANSFCMVSGFGGCSWNLSWNRIGCLVWWIRWILCQGDPVVLTAIWIG